MMKYYSKLSLSIYGILILALGMGLGRFIYTPLVPILLNENIFSFSELSQIASANYAGYLVGSLLFSISFFYKRFDLKSLIYFFCITTFLLLFCMSISHNLYLSLLIRFMAGISSAGLMIFGSMSIFKNTNNSTIIAALYSGVGVGILIGNEFINMSLLFGINSQQIWIGSAMIGGVIFTIITLLYPSKASTIQSNLILTNANMPWYALIILYGLAGFGYIITATYLPFMVKDFNSAFLEKHLWSLVGISIIPGCFLWSWIESKIGISKALIFNLILQSICIFMTIQNHSSIILFGTAGFGLTFMGTTTLAMKLAKQIQAPKTINLFGLITLTYGIGQIIGPIYTDYIVSRTHSINISIITASIILLLASFIVFINMKKHYEPKNISKSY